MYAKYADEMEIVRRSPPASIDFVQTAATSGTSTLEQAFERAFGGANER